MKIPKDIKAVIFDLDGLLINSEPYWDKTDYAFFAKYGKKFTLDISRKTTGMGQRENMEFFIKTFDIPGDRDMLIVERRKMFYQQFLPNMVLMEGAEKLIRIFHKKGFSLAIATSGHTREKTLKIIKKLKIDNYFSVLVSGDDVKKSKPAPDIYLKTAELLQVKPAECLVIEDAPNGAIAGKAAGMTVYGVNSGRYFHDRLQEEGADEVFSSLSEITL